jgi:hypothetical protein
MTKTKKKKRFGIWPDIYDLQSAKDAMKEGIIVCAVISAVSIGLAIASQFGFKFLGFDLSAILDGILFLLIGLGIYKKSRVASALGFALYIIERIFMWAEYGGPRNIVIAFVIVIVLITSMRGTSFYHELRKSYVIKRNVIILNLLALLYSIIIFCAVSFIAIYFFPLTFAELINGEVVVKDELFILNSGSFAITYIITLMRVMPFTRKREIVYYKLSEEDVKNVEVYEVVDESGKGVRMLECPECDFSVDEEEFTESEFFCPRCKSRLEYGY